LLTVSKSLNGSNKSQLEELSLKSGRMAKEHAVQELINTLTHPNWTKDMIKKLKIIE
jgi:hypothetical protein